MCGEFLIQQEESIHFILKCIMYTQELIISYWMANFCPGVCNVKYHDIVISDHCPVSVSLGLLETMNSCQPWRFNPQLLTKKWFCKYLETQIKFLF